MNIQLKATASVLAVAAVTSGLCAYTTYQSNVRVIEAAKQREMQTAITLIQNGMQEQSNRAAALARAISELPSVRTAFRTANRDGLASELVPAALLEKKDFGVHDAHFATPPAFSFLRLYKLDTGHGEDMSGFREMVLTANRRHELQKGIEISTSGLNIRGVAPIRDDKGHIGSFEIGLPFTPILEDLKKTTGFDGGVFIDEELMDRVATRAPKPTDDQIIGGYRNIESTDWQSLKPLLNPDLLTTATDTVKKVLNVHGVPYGEVVVPVMDFKGKRIGMVAAARNFDMYEHEANQALLKSWGIAGLQALAIIGGLLLLLRRYLLNPMTTFAHTMTQLANGRQGSDLRPLMASQDEMGEIARNLADVAKEIAGHQAKPVATSGDA